MAVATPLDADLSRLSGELMDTAIYAGKRPKMLGALLIVVLTAEALMMRLAAVLHPPRRHLTSLGGPGRHGWSIQVPVIMHF